jgi:hypothetical protein
VPFPLIGAKYFFVFDKVFPATWMERLILVGTAEKKVKK